MGAWLLSVSSGLLGCMCGCRNCMVNVTGGEKLGELSFFIWPYIIVRVVVHGLIAR